MPSQKISNAKQWNEIFHSHVDEAMNAADTNTQPSTRRKNQNTERGCTQSLLAYGMVWYGFNTQYLNNIKRNSTQHAKQICCEKKKEENVYVNHIFLCLHEWEKNNNFYPTTLAFNSLACALHLTSILGCVSVFKGKWNYERIFNEN